MTKRSDLLARLTAELARTTTRNPTDWYRIEAAKDQSAEVYVYDHVYPGSASEFARQIAGLDVSTINLKLNSPGGYVFDGIAIYNSLRTHKATVHVTVDGLAASIGSVIAMAGDTVTMGRGTEMMIHDPSGGVFGQAPEMREMADLLDRLAGDMAGLYHDKAGGDVAHWRAAMAAETWYSAQEAVDAGLADAVIGTDPPPEKPSAKTAAVKAADEWDLSAYRFAGRDQAPGPVAVARKTRSDDAKARVLNALGGVRSK